MPKALVVYDSATGNTEKMAVAISQGMKSAALEVETKRVDSVSPDDLIEADAIVLGSPTYFGSVSNNVKRFIDSTHEIYPDRLKDKIGAGFTSSEGVGYEIALLTIVTAMLMHGMVIVGHQSGEFGAASLAAPNEAQIAECRVFGERIARITKAMVDK